MKTQQGVETIAPKLSKTISRMHHVFLLLSLLGSCKTSGGFQFGNKSFRIIISCYILLGMFAGEAGRMESI